MYNVYHSEETKLMFLRNILERHHLFHDSFKEEVDALMLPGEQSTVHSTDWFLRNPRVHDFQMTVT